ncbi:ATP-binding cassette domain-containing protein [Nocardia sp. NPDC020380]|uniref:ATP-binding cassette domain-containing protein n=1 Tax=Nocardia sp. NPDC020380 TaxID=3364309 RepID=UPI0037961C8D
MTGPRPLAFAATGLSKTFETRTAVDDISFVVPTRTVAALVGPPGAGKTTVLRLLLGQLTPTAGSATMGTFANTAPASAETTVGDNASGWTAGGNDGDSRGGGAPGNGPATLGGSNGASGNNGTGTGGHGGGIGVNPIYARSISNTSNVAASGGLGVSDTPGADAVGAVLTPRGLHSRRKVRDQLRVYAAAAGVSDARVDGLLTQTRLDEVAEQRIDRVTEGVRTRLALAIALLGDPQLLLLDDPTAGLDAAETAWLYEYLNAHARRGGTVLLTSRTLSSVIPVADELIVLDTGRIVYQGSPARLRRSHPDRLLVKASSPIALATMLAARGFTDAVMRPDGRLAIAETSLAELESAAAAVRVQLTEVTSEHIHPDQVLAALTRPTGSAVRTPAIYGAPR